MARTTARDLIEASLRELGVLAEGETASAAGADDALDALNALIDQWAAEKLTIYAVTRTTATLTASQTSFTVGSGGNINIARPVHIERIGFIDTSTTPDTEYPLESLTEDAWANIRLKAQTAEFPQVYYYSPTFPTGTLYPWPIPTNASLQWAVYHWAALSELSGLTTAFSLPPAYERMIVKQLAVDLAPSYEKEPSGTLVRQAQDAMAVVKRANKRLEDLSFDPATLTNRRWGGYSIRLN
jgi:hypothetical protein